MENQYFTYVKEYILTFTSILYEAMPFIVLGAVIAGILEEFVPQRLIARVLPRIYRRHRNARRSGPEYDEEKNERSEERDGPCARGGICAQDSRIIG